MTSSFIETEAEVYEDKVAPEIQPLESENLAETAILDEGTGFFFNEVEAKDPFQMKVVDPETIDPDSQMQMEFEIPLKSKEDAEQTSSVANELNEGLSQDKKVKNFDETALEIKFELKNTEEETPIDHNQVPLVEETKTVEQLTDKAEDPFDKSINETLAVQNDKRKEHLKAFNHKFMHQMQRVDDMEKQPAYKRQGLDLDSDLPEAHSRTTLNIDNNDDLQMRSNNSFLHDNVD